MPLIHFGYGRLHREGKTLEQLDSFVENILLPRNLMSFECPEFFPITTNPTSQLALPSSAYDNGSGWCRRLYLLVPLNLCLAGDVGCSVCSVQK
jgi:hypothetical protein